MEGQTNVAGTAGKIAKMYDLPLYRAGTKEVQTKMVRNAAGNRGGGCRLLYND